MPTGFNDDKLKWLLESSPNYKIVVKGDRLFFENFSNKTMARFTYLARKEKLSFRGFIIKCLVRGMR